MAQWECFCRCVNVHFVLVLFLLVGTLDLLLCAVVQSAYV